jgi:4-hydroxy-tetrahydrodipicolinate reductase
VNITLIGYGKMGKEIDRLATDRGIGVIDRVSSRTTLKDADIQRSDVAIHFARPDSVVSHVERWAALKKNMVVGTTGWAQEFDTVKSIATEAGIGFVYASNFSIGVNIFYRLVREASKLINRFGEYDAFVHEAHHKDKVDSPSGTALAAAKIIVEHIQRKKTILSDPPQGKIRPDQLQVTSTRAGAIVGTHTVTFDSVADSIELKHSAKNRSGFALGALLAAEWVVDKHGIFTMEDVLAETLR